MPEADDQDDHERREEERPRARRRRADEDDAPRDPIGAAAGRRRATRRRRRRGGLAPAPAATSRPERVPALGVLVEVGALEVDELDELVEHGLRRVQTSGRPGSPGRCTAARPRSGPCSRCSSCSRR